MALRVRFDAHYGDFFRTHGSTWVLHLSDDTRARLKAPAPGTTSPSCFRRVWTRISSSRGRRREFGISARCLGFAFGDGHFGCLPSFAAGGIYLGRRQHVTGNSLIRAADGLFRFWCTTQAADYWPVTSTTFWIEWRLWGLNAAGYHATNLILHLAAVLLLWRVLRRLQLPGAYLAASSLLFTRSTLSRWRIGQREPSGDGFFPGLDLLVSVAWLEAKGSGRYWLSLTAFVLGLLSKGSIAMLPFVLAGLIAWRRRLTLRDLARLAPFLMIAALLVGVDMWFQKQNSIQAIRSAGLVERILGAGAVVWFYLGKALWPVKLAFVYPAWRIDTGDWRWWAPLVMMIRVTGLLLGRRTVPPVWSRSLWPAWDIFA